MFFDYVHLGGVADIPEGCATIQQDLDKLQSWVERNLMRLNKGNCRVLYLRIRTWVFLWTTGWLQASSVPLWPRRPMVSWDLLKRFCPEGQQGDSPSLLCPGKALSGVLCAVLGSSVQDREFLKRVQQRVTKMVRDLEHLPLISYRSLSCLSV